MKKMKKIVSAILVATMVMSMGMTAFATEGETTDSTESSTPSYASDVATLPLKKTYTKADYVTLAKTYPSEELNFTITPGSNPSSAKISIGEGETDSYTVTGVENTIVIDIPSYDKVGNYTYTVKEESSSTQGVGYTAEDGTTNEFVVQVFAYWNEDHTKILTKYNMKKNDAKITEIKNTYDLGDLTVSKTVTGNLGDKEQDFNASVKLTAANPVKSVISYKARYDAQTESTIAIDAWEKDGDVYTVTVPVVVKDGASVTFTNIPKDVSYEVTEDAAHALPDSTGANGAAGYTVTYDGKTGTIVADKTGATMITNTKESDIATGISLDNMPYIMVLALVALGLVGFVSKKRSMEF